jgi:glutathione S-transferase
MESGAILMYLAEKHGRFMPSGQAKWPVIEWLMIGAYVCCPTPAPPSTPGSPAGLPRVVHTRGRGQPVSSARNITSACPPRSL